MTHAPSARTKALEKRRLKAGTYFEQGKTQAWVARHFEVSTATTNAWAKAWKKEGQTGLFSKGRPGAPPKLTREQLKNVERALLKGPKSFGYATDLWTLERVAKLMKKTTGASYHPGHVWKILGGMGWSAQKPETRARERNERKIKTWIKETFPSLQKKGSKKASSLDSSTNQAFPIAQR